MSKPLWCCEMMNANYDCSWDLSEGDPGYSDKCDEALDKKFDEWETRKWHDWLSQNLTFPFAVSREEDMDEWGEADEDAPFQVGHKMQVLELAEMEDDQIAAKHSSLHRITAARFFPAKW